MMAFIKKELEIEFKNEQGEQDYRYLDVEFKVKGQYLDFGIGSYEYWGMRGYDSQMGWEIDDITWDKSLYSEEDNKWIDDYVERRMDDFVDDIDNYAKNN